MESHEIPEQSTKAQAEAAPQSKVLALQEATLQNFPTVDIDQVLLEIEQGYQETLPA